MPLDNDSCRCHNLILVIRSAAHLFLQQQLIDLRIYYKDALNRIEQDTDEREARIERYNTLKKFLVCLYGTVGFVLEQVRECISI